MPKTFAAILASAVLFAATAAEAQSMRRYFPPNAGVMTISTSFRTNIPVEGPADVVSEAKATEAARRSMYEIASRECEVIAKVFKGDCKLRNVNVNSYVQEVRPGQRQISVNLNATYQVLSDQGDMSQDGKKL